MKLHSLAILSLTIVLCAMSIRAENWPNWRGPHFDGSTTETGLPDQLSLDKNLAWKMPLPGRSGATPAVWGDKVFVSSANDTDPDKEAAKKLFAICINRADGKEIWRKEISHSDQQWGRNNSASPSPVTDGQGVYFLYANGDLVKLSMGGDLLWQRSITKDYGDFTILWGYGNSPLLYKDKLYITVLRRDNWKQKSGKFESLLLALNPKDGSEIWKHVRKSDGSNETQESYATPIPVDVKGQMQLVINDGASLTGHDLATGNELWRFGSYMNPPQRGDCRMVVSPVAGEGYIYCTAAKKVSPIYAVKPEGASGNVKPSTAAWSLTENQTDCSTPLFYNGFLYVLDGDKKVLMKVDPKTGNKVWSGSLPPGIVFRSSPTGGDGKIYFVRANSEVYVCDAGDQFKILSKLELNEGNETAGTFASVALSQGNVFVRTPTQLYCFKK